MQFSNKFFAVQLHLLQDTEFDFYLKAQMVQISLNSVNVSFYDELESWWIFLKNLLGFYEYVLQFHSPQHDI